MANGNGTAPAPTTLMAAILSINSKIVLAFFLTTVAAAMVVFLLVALIIAGPTKLDVGTTALISSMIMLFIKMAADANGYQTQSSAGSDKKDDTNAVATGALAEKVTAPVVPASAASAPIVLVKWWDLLEPPEKEAIEAAKADPRVQVFLNAAPVGRAVISDMEYLVSKNLLTKERFNLLTQDRKPKETT